MGLSAVVLGILLLIPIKLGGIDFSRLFTVTGGGLLITSVFVSLNRLLTPT